MSKLTAQTFDNYPILACRSRTTRPTTSLHTQSMSRMYVPTNYCHGINLTYRRVQTQPIWVYCRQAGKTPASHCGAGMVFAVNCGADGAPNSFTNFKAAALAVGASLSAAAPAPSATAPSTWTAAYGGYTIAPAPEPVPVTQTVTLESSTWVTSYSSYPNSPAPTPAALAGSVLKVIVGGPGKLTFDPPHISAKPRDTVVFELYVGILSSNIFILNSPPVPSHQKNHTVTQSSFADPCRKLSANGVEGWDSGL